MAEGRGAAAPTRALSVGPGDRTSLVVAAVATGGAAALAGVLLSYPPSLDAGLLGRALILVAVTAVAELVAIRLQHGSQSELITLLELAVVADIVFLPPSAAVAVAIAGLAVALAVQRRTPIKAIFNLGQYALGITTAAAIYQAGGGEFAKARGVATLALGMAAFTIINLLTISAILAATEGRPLSKVLADGGGLSFAAGIGNSAVGIVAVSLLLDRPVLLPAVLAPALALHHAFRGWVKEKELSRRMEQEKAKLERIVEHSSEGIVLAMGDGTVALWSPAMERMTGIPASEAEGRALPFLLRGRGRQGEPIEVGVSEEPDEVELEVVTTGGARRWLRVQHGPARNGRLSADVLVVDDVTRRREVERLKDDFISTISHELRTPLTPIKGFASLLLMHGDRLPRDQRRQALESIVAQSDRMTRLVEDLLLVSDASRREERDRGEAPPVDVAAVAEEVLERFRRRHPQREFRLSAPSATVASADPLRLDQVLANLVSNAVKFSPAGAPVCLSIDREEGRARIRVQDSGRGIPPDKREEIFEKFRRLEDPMRMETGGAGLGLYIVRELVAGMRGEVRVASEPGRGSTFTVLLPLADGAGRG